MSASLALAALRRRWPRRGAIDGTFAVRRDPPDRLDTLFHLGCTAMAAAATAAALFAAAVEVLASGGDGVSTRPAMRAGSDWTSASTAVPVSAPTVAAVAISERRRPQVVPAEHLAQLSSLIEIAPAFFAGPELGRNPGRQDPAPAAPATASAEIVSGPVTQIADAMTWVVGGQTVRLWGIRSDRAAPLPDLAAAVARVSAAGAVECRRQLHSPRYRCVTAAREDVAELALQSGIGRASAGASVAYRNAEARARQAGRGLWAGR